MAYSLSSLPDELCCSICTEIFKEPVILKCSHSFCRSCLQDCWKHRISQECPVCRKKCSEDEPVLNQSLKEVADLFLQKNNQSAIQNEYHCSLHGEKLLLFCEDDLEILCALCLTSKEHRNHQLCSAEEAFQDKKEELKAVLNPIKEHVKKLTEAKKEYDETISQIKIQARDTERQIKEEYERIYQFLRDEEKSRLIALRKEEEENIQRVMEMMDNISKHISTLSGKIESTERRLIGDDLTFLKMYKDMKQRLDFKLQDPELLSGGLIDVNKHLEPLKLRMKNIIEHRPKSSFSLLNLFPSTNNTSKPTPVKVHVAVSGPTLNSHQTFMRKLDMSLEECSLEKCSVILVFCPVVTRMGTDIDAVMRNIPDGKATVLVLMHHTSTPEHVFELQIPATRNNVVKVVQCVFHESAGPLECELNRRAVRAVRSELEFYQ